MANHASALKRARQNENRRRSNRMTKTRIKNVVKNVRQAAAAQAAEAATTTLNTAKSMIAKAAKKGVIHRKNASRKVSRLAKLAIRSKA